MDFACHAGAVDLRNAVANKYAVELPATIVYDYPSPEALAAYVTKQLSARTAPAVSELPPAPGQEELSWAGRMQTAAGPMTSDVTGISCRYPSAESGERLIIAMCTHILSGISVVTTQMTEASELRRARRFLRGHCRVPRRAEPSAAGALGSGSLVCPRHTAAPHGQLHPVCGLLHAHRPLRGTSNVQIARFPALLGLAQLC